MSPLFKKIIALYEYTGDPAGNHYIEAAKENERGMKKVLKKGFGEG